MQKNTSEEECITTFYTKRMILFFKSKGKQALNAFWYIFIILIIGQIGPIIGYAKAIWSGSPVLQKIDESAARGELLTCAIAILAAGTYFLIKEYNSSSSQIGNRPVKSWLLLWTIFCGFCCVLISVELLSNPEAKFSINSQRWLHWIFYISAMTTAFLLWMLEEWQTTAAEETSKWSEQSSDITIDSKKVKTSKGIRI